MKISDKRKFNFFLPYLLLKIDLKSSKSERNFKALLKHLYSSYHSNVKDTLRTTGRNVKTNPYLLFGAFFLNFIHIHVYCYKPRLSIM